MRRVIKSLGAKDLAESRNGNSEILVWRNHRPVEYGGSEADRCHCDEMSQIGADVSRGFSRGDMTKEEQ
jgi:hypothetical protein